MTRTGRAAERVLDTLPDLLLGGGLPLGDEAPATGSDAPGSGGRRLRRVFRRRPRLSAGPLVRVIEPRQPGSLARIREFWRYRALTWYFGRQALEKLYKKTWLGWLWIPLRPVISVGSRVLVFGGLLGAPSEGVPYLLFFLVGLSTWQLFAYTLFWATRSLELARRVLRRMYVPRLTCLVGSVVPSAVNFLLYVAIALIVVACYALADGTTHLELGSHTVGVAAGILLSVLLALAIGCWTSVLGAQARDVRFVVGYVLGFWFFLTPIIYPLSEVPAAFQTVASINPMTAPIELVRSGLFGVGGVPATAMLSCLSAIAIIGIPGLWFFSRSEAAALDAL